MNSKLIIYFFYILLFTSCTSCKDEMVDKNVFWKSRICGNDLIGNAGLGYPVYNNTVVFHSTPVAGDDDENSILYGLDTETGKEKWRLTNADFSPKKKLYLNNADYYYQNENIVVCSDFYYDETREHYVYAIDIEKGKVLWIKELPSGYTEMGRLVRGSGKYAYIDAADRYSHFSLLRVDIETGELSIVLDITNEDLPVSLQQFKPSFRICTFSDVYKNSLGDEFIALSLNGVSETRKPFLMSLYVYNLTKQQKAYTIPVACEDSLHDGNYGRICYHDGKLIIGKGNEVLCFDAYEDKGTYWKHFLGTAGNDFAMQVFGCDNLALGFTVDRLFCYDINTGGEYYNTKAAGSNTANVIDGIIYQRDGSDFQMRDPKTGKELKRIATGRNEQAFSSSRPNGADGRIYVHTYTDAYCIKAWGK
jgi:outer membrane protein assembly factor BamB